MVDIEIEFERGKSPRAFAAQLEAFKTALDTELERAMQEAVTLVERGAKERAPVDTGRLRASIASMVRDDVEGAIAGYVGSSVDYAPFQEFGTSKMGAQPYLRPAIEANRERITERFTQAVDNAAAAAGLS